MCLEKDSFEGMVYFNGYKLPSPTYNLSISILLLFPRFGLSDSWHSRLGFISSADSHNKHIP